MVIPFVPDLSVFFAGEFSEIVSIGGGNVSGIFEDPFGSVEDIEGSTPRFKTETASLPSLVPVPSFVRTKTGQSYKITSSEPSGRGVTILILQEC